MISPNKFLCLFLFLAVFGSAFAAISANASGWPVLDSGASVVWVMEDLVNDGAGKLEVVAINNSMVPMANSLVVYYSNGTLAPGWPVVLSSSSINQVITANLSGGAYNQIVVVNGTTNILAYYANGTNYLGSTPVLISPGGKYAAAWDVDGDHVDEILVGLSATPNETFLIEGTGANLTGWPINLGDSAGANAIVSFGDLDQDGTAEILVGLNDTFYAMYKNGTQKCSKKVSNKDSGLIGFAVGNTSTVGTTIMSVAVSFKNDTAGNDFWLTVLDSSCNPGTNWPRSVSNGSTYLTPPVLFPSTNGDAPCVFVGSGARVYGLRANDGSVVCAGSYPYSLNTAGRPGAFASELALTSMESGSSSAQLVFIDRNESMANNVDYLVELTLGGAADTGYPYQLPAQYSAGSAMDNYAPVIADINNDGRMEIGMALSYTGFYMYNVTNTTATITSSTTSWKMPRSNKGSQNIYGTASDGTAAVATDPRSYTYWPQFGHDSARSGWNRNDTLTVGDTGTLSWSNTSITGVPIVLNSSGTAYVYGFNVVSNKLYCFYGNGTEAWNTMINNTAGGTVTTSIPVAATESNVDYIYATVNGASENVSKLYAVNGTKVWSINLPSGGSPEGVPMYYSDGTTNRLYASTSTKKYKLSTTSGAVDWTYTLQQSTIRPATMQYGGSATRVLFLDWHNLTSVSADGGVAAMSVNISQVMGATGAITCSTPVYDLDGYSSLGIVYLGCNDAGSGSNYTFAYISNGTQYWNTTAVPVGEVTSYGHIPAFDTTHVYIGAPNGTMYALWKNNGTTSWTYTPSSPSSVSFEVQPSIANNILYIASDKVSYNGTLFAINTTSHSLLWSYQINSSTGAQWQEGISIFNQSIYAAGASSDVGLQKFTISYAGADTTAPTTQNVGANDTTIDTTESVKLYAQGKDTISLDFAVLSTNESGAWVNYTTGTYSSPADMGDAVNTWTWSNFTWSNSSVARGTWVGWRIWYNDSSSNWGTTAIQQFKIAELKSVTVTKDADGIITCSGASCTVTGDTNITLPEDTQVNVTYNRTGQNTTVTMTEFNITSNVSLNFSYAISINTDTTAGGKEATSIKVNVSYLKDQGTNFTDIVLDAYDTLTIPSDATSYVQGTFFRPKVYACTSWDSGTNNCGGTPTLLLEGAGNYSTVSSTAGTFQILSPSSTYVGFQIREDSEVTYLDASVPSSMRHSLSSTNWISTSESSTSTNISVRTNVSFNFTLKDYSSSMTITLVGLNITANTSVAITSANTIFNYTASALYQAALSSTYLSGFQFEYAIIDFGTTVSNAVVEKCLDASFTFSSGACSSWTTLTSGDGFTWVTSNRALKVTSFSAYRGTPGSSSASAAGDAVDIFGISILLLVGMVVLYRRR